VLEIIKNSVRFGNVLWNDVRSEKWTWDLEHGASEECVLWVRVTERHLSGSSAHRVWGEVGSLDWIDVAPGTDKRRSLVNTVGSLRVAWNAGNFVSSWGSSSFWRASRMELFIVGCSLTSTGMRQASVVELLVLSSVLYYPVRSWTSFGVIVCVCLCVYGPG